MPFSERWKTVRPAWILAVVIFIGWIIGTIGDNVTVCPPSLLISCQPASNYVATNFLAQNNALVVYYHQYFQLFSSMLITDNPVDFLFNAIAVLVLDLITEDNLNKTRYFAVFVSTALIGNMLTLLNGPNYASAGASGGIFGIYAALITFTFLKDKKMDILPIALFVVIFVGSSVLPGVNYLAHLGGAVGGFIAGAIIYESVKPTITEYSMAYDSSKRTIAITSIAFLLIVILSSLQFFSFV